MLYDEAHNGDHHYERNNWNRKYHIAHISQ